MKRQFILIRIPVMLFLTILALTIAGCTAAPQSSRSNPASEPLPVYRQGTTFVYSDGTWETVAAVAANVVTWKDYRGYTATGTPDFTHRPVYYETHTRTGTRTFKPREDLIVMGNPTLWPLSAGKRASYTEVGTWTEKQDGSQNSYSNTWSCEVAGTERVAVAAGEFETWKIICTRSSVFAPGARPRPEEIKTWYYAPQIGHYVLATSNYLYDKASRRQELLAVLPPQEDLPAQARSKMNESFQNALERQMSGAPAFWSMPGTASGEITPSGTFKLAHGTYCRRYVQELNLPHDQQTYYGLACRDSDGRWDIPRK
jgi:hypothetical protein